MSRYFYGISFVLIIAVTFFTGIYGRSYVEDNIIKVVVGHNNTSITNSFAKTVWNTHRKTIIYLPCGKRKCPDILPLQKDVELFFQGLPLLKSKVFNADGTEIFSNGKIVNNQNSKNKQILSVIKNNKTITELIFSYVVDGKKYNVVRTRTPIIPLLSRKDRVAGVLETVYDVTDFWSNPKMFQIFWISTICIAAILIFGTMYFTMQNTERLVSKQYELNIDLTSAKAKAEAESRAKSQFLANVSHELRTPLNAIIGFSEVIKDEVMGPLNNTQYKDYVTDIHGSGVHLLSLINDILDYSKADAGKLTVDLAEVDVTKIMKNSMRLIMPRADESGVTLIEEIPKEHHILVTDGKRLKQVLLNLLSNSVKFTPEGGKITLCAWHDITEDSFVIEVRDTGVGIEPKDISKVMATFGQVENKLSRRYEGTGLGLPLARKLVELMRGNLHIQSQIGKGTAITIVLPMEIQKATAIAEKIDQYKEKNDEEINSSRNTDEEF